MGVCTPTSLVMPLETCTILTYVNLKQVVEEIEHEHVVQLMTDNGLNFKKACLQHVTEYPHIPWQPCVVHTINLI